MDNKEIYKCKDIVNYFYKNKIDIDMIALTRLIYFANGMRLAVEGKPLIQEKFKAWKYGPGLDEIYFNMNLAKEDKPNLPDSIVELLDSVYNTFNKTYDELINITSIKEGAWDKAVKLGDELSNDDIIEEFKNIHIPRLT